MTYKMKKKYKNTYLEMFNKEKRWTVCDIVNNTLFSF